MDTPISRFCTFTITLSYWVPIVISICVYIYVRRSLLLYSSNLSFYPITSTSECRVQTNWSIPQLLHVWFQRVTWVLTWGWPHPLLLELSSFESPSHEDQDSVNKKAGCNFLITHNHQIMDKKLWELVNESTYMKSKHRVCMKYFHQPQ